MPRKIIIGSRGSDLALWQANFATAQLKENGVDAEIKIIKTKGDRIQHLSFDKMEGKGFFTKEIESALLNKDIDLAVHSHKDLETTPPEGLKIAAVSHREDPSELLLVRKETVDERLKFGLQYQAVVGTSSARRKSQLLSLRPDVQIKDIRGNVPTRIQKLRDGQYDAILLAFAGVHRLKLDLSEFHIEKLSPREFIPAPAQGALAFQIRENDRELENILAKISDQEVKELIDLERRVLNLFDGGCQLPLGIYCTKVKEAYNVRAAMAESWNGFPKRLFWQTGSLDNLAEKIVKQLNEKEKLSVFITREISEKSYLQNALQSNGYTITGKPLIKIVPVRFSSTPKTDWIFFSSRNAVKHFFDQQPEINNGVKMGVVGSGTQRMLQEYDRKADFVGRHADIKKVGDEFAAVSSGKSILFPQAKDSLQSVQKQLDFSSGIYDLYVYRTELIQADIPESDIIIFTSPSNVRSYLDQKKPGKNQQVIAMGKSTERELNKHQVKNVILPEMPDELGLADAIFSI